jgi:hypothetical protein
MDALEWTNTAALQHSTVLSRMTQSHAHVWALVHEVLLSRNPETSQQHALHMAQH